MRDMTATGPIDTSFDVAKNYGKEIILSILNAGCTANDGLRSIQILRQKQSKDHIGQVKLLSVHMTYSGEPERCRQ